MVRRKMLREYIGTQYAPYDDENWWYGKILKGMKSGAIPREKPSNEEGAPVYEILNYVNAADSFYTRLGARFSVFQALPQPVKYAITTAYNQAYMRLKDRMTDLTRMESVNRGGRNLVKITESDLHRIVKESVKRVLKEGFGKGEKYTYKTEDGDATNCEFVTSTFEDGYPYSVGLIDHNKKEVYPCHGYHYPNRCAKGLMKKALSLGYTYVDGEMPSEMNKTLLKKTYKSGEKEGIFLGQIKEISPSMGVLEKYEIVDIIWQKQEREPGATWWLTKVAMKKVE